MEKARTSGRREALEIVVRGTVQGVGFRPFVHRLAVECGLCGHVANTPGSVLLHLEGDPAGLQRFRRRMKAEAPPASRVTGVRSRRVAPLMCDGFAIRESRRLGLPLSTIPPDIALCPDCVRELSDPRDRRYGYPFTNCTNCGPRFTIVSRLPYDREGTSMTRFPMCPECRREYADPRDRRFHAEPNACPACGPSLSLADAGGARVPTDDPVGEAARALLGGKILALRGLGGFQLAADATGETPVRLLRERKGREEKPFAVMVADLAQARGLAVLSPADEAILRSPAAPILLCETASGGESEGRTGRPLAPSVAPGLSCAGLFLPYTPIHRMLLSRVGRPLVVTSGNRTDEPIAIGNDEALARLAGIADFFLLHDREVLQRADDSVVRNVAGRPYPIRRARGFVPAPVPLPQRTVRRIARGGDAAGLGGELKAAFCILRRGVPFLSQHVGDLGEAGARAFYRETFAFFRSFLDADLRAVCHDLHPAYFTTAFARELPVGRVVPLQHHKAHLYALMAETGFRGRAVGVAFDGTGYGEDGTVWGGEFFAIDGMEMRRAASLAPFPLQGGDSAVRAPWKTGLSLLLAAYPEDEAVAKARELFPGVGEDAIRLAADAMRQGVNVVPTTSGGRLFDGISALAGCCTRATYEGQAAMLLEGVASRGRRGKGRYPFAIRPLEGRLTIDWTGIAEGVAADRLRGEAAADVARRFHDTLTDATVEVCARLAENTGTGAVLLSGGVFQNARLLAAVTSGLRARRLSPRIHRHVPPNDGGICLGQAWYAAMTTAGG